MTKRLTQPKIHLPFKYGSSGYGDLRGSTQNPFPDRLIAYLLSILTPIYGNTPFFRDHLLLTEKFPK